MKGITPIISTIVLLLITVALAGAAWVYIGGFMGTYTEKSFTIPTGGVYCDAGGKFHVRIVNTGTTTIKVGTGATRTGGDLTKFDVTNDTAGWILDTTNPNNDIATRGNGELTTNATVSSNTPSTLNKQPQKGASYTVTVGTVAGIQRIPVVCP